MNAASLGLVVIALGIALIVIGTMMTLADWKRGSGKAQLAQPFDWLTKLLQALVHYPTGQRLIVFGIVLIVLGGLLAGVSGMPK